MTSVEIVEQFAKYGGLIGLLFGLIVAGMAFAIIRLWKQNLKLHDTIRDSYEARVEESREMNSHLIEYTNKSNEVVSGITHAMNSLKDAILLQQRQ